MGYESTTDASLVCKSRTSVPWSIMEQYKIKKAKRSTSWGNISRCFWSFQKQVGRLVLKFYILGKKKKSYRFSLSPFVFVCLSHIQWSPPPPKKEC